MTPHELLASVDAWLRTLAGRYARRHRLDADDVLQLSRLLVLSAAGRYDPAKGKPTTWAAWQVLHAASGLLREREKFGRVSLAPPEILADHPTRADADAAELPYLDHLSPALDCLPARHRRMLELRHVDGCELVVIGKALGVSRQRVFQMHKTATAKVRTAILSRAHPQA